MAVQMRLRRLNFECDWKHAFSTHAAAQRSAKRLYRRKGERAHPYKCGVCNRWHVGGNAVLPQRRRVESVLTAVEIQLLAEPYRVLRARP